MKIAPVVCSLALLAGCASNAPSPQVNRLMEDATKGAWDVAVVAIDPERRAIVDFARGAATQMGLSRTLKNASVLAVEDSFAGLHLAFAVPKNRPAAAGLQGEVSVAPPEQESTYKGM
jgi:hypothetical protein